MKKILVIISLFLTANLFAADQDTTTQRGLRTLVRDILGGVSTSSTWPDATIDRLVNLSGREYALLVGISRRDTIVTTSGVKEYALNSDFLRIRGVTIYNISDDKRETALLYRAPRVMGAAAKAYGEDDDHPHPKYYTVAGAGQDTLNAGKYLIVDPPEEEDDRDTLVVYYFAQAIELGKVAADTITNIPYEGIPLVVQATVKYCLIKNREYPALPSLDKMYDMNRAILIQENSDMEYNPNLAQ